VDDETPSETSPEMDDEGCRGPAVSLIVGMLDPRPGADACEIGSLKDPVLSDLAARARAAVAARAGEGPLPSMGKFNSAAELADVAGCAVLGIKTNPWGFGVLADKGFYELAMELLEDDILPRGAVKVLEFLYYPKEPMISEEQEPLRVKLAWQFLAAGFMRFLLDRTEGTSCRLLLRL
jgi:hypothetical protein